MGSSAQVALSLQPYGTIGVGEEGTVFSERHALADQGQACQFGVARSEWYANVLGPIRQSDFVYFELSVPNGGFAESWQQALKLLVEAEAAWANGDDDAVFHRLRGVLDSLPGAKQDILAGVTNGKKRAAIDALVKQYGQYLHVGRHVPAPGQTGAGSFPVDHRDAGFAIAQMKMMLSYMSQLVRSFELD